jgi:hypothetical protein
VSYAAGAQRDVDGHGGVIAELHAVAISGLPTRHAGIVAQRRGDRDVIDQVVLGEQPLRDGGRRDDLTLGALQCRREGVANSAGSIPPEPSRSWLTSPATSSGTDG